ncbi:NCS2 family permease [Clostridium tertium]|uniref:NCS2 family permease n=1 Tax=Clostridium TaxID=1485 RepID=UPI000C06CF5A|nr:MULTISPECIES: NCS2 family permease [Clostridium]MBS5307347.1 NCS2 family permease [Clostridium sp.]MBS5884739.1 NCS2 family permease [Clostridium sp.]MBU6136721.1 NCS2 family permease [Clostridium tertium]MDB1921488.1 NCS2 family permease [Clostridium tertium]MDB1924732.1 NCS2 family permease [Clostridium tertium]
MLEKIFKFQERNTNARIEITAGITTFMTMAYILVLQPMFMGAAGMEVGAVTVVTAILSAIFSIFMGIYTNLPFALAPAMGSNAFFAYTLVAGGIVNWETGLGMVFISGVVFILLTVLGLREVIVNLIPKNIKYAIGVAVGFYIVLLGFKNGGLMSLEGGSIAMGDVKSPGVLLTIIGLVIVVFLQARKVKGGVLVAIILTTIIGIPMGITNVPESLVTMPPSIEPIAFKLDIMAALKWSFFPLMFTFFVGDFFSTLGTLLGVSAKANLLDEEGNLPNINKPFLVDAIATVVGALFGSTVVTTYIESAAGVEEGGRTGFTAVVAGICFALTMFITPIAGMIPSEATAPALILIGLLMITGVKNIEFNDFTEAFPAFATIVFTAFTSSISNGISIGIISYMVTKVMAGRFKDLNWGIYILSIPLIAYFII